MPSKNSADLLSRLRTSLPKVEPERSPLPSAASSVTEAAPVALHAEATPASLKGIRAPKLSVSLYQRDIDRLDTIKDFMKSQGFRNLSDSEALRLACRKVEIDGALIEVYRSMQGEDGRRRQD